MDYISTKPKSWTAQIAELTVNEEMSFPIEHERSIRAIISGNNRGGLKENYPKRQFKTKQIVKESVGGEETKILVVKRVK
jgi:hypothetical protein